MAYYDPNLQSRMQGVMPIMGQMGSQMGMMPQYPQQMMPMQQQMMMNGQMGYTPGMAMQNLGYNYQLPTLGYSMQSSWSPWDIAHNHARGTQLERSMFDSIIGTLDKFFSERHLSEEAAKEAHRRVYYEQQGQDSGNRTLGGAAAYQAFLWWDHEHYQLYHQSPSVENRDRLVALAIGELHKLWDAVQPRSRRARFESALEYCAATGRYLFERHYGIHHHNSFLAHSQKGNHSHRRHSSSDSDSSKSSRRRKRSSSHHRHGSFNGPQATDWAYTGIGQGYGAQGMNGMYPGYQYGMPGMGQPGMPGMPGMMQGVPGMQGVQGMPGMMPGVMQPGMPGMMGMQPGMMPMMDPTQQFNYQDPRYYQQYGYPQQYQQYGYRY